MEKDKSFYFEHGNTPREKARSYGGRTLDVTSVNRLRAELEVQDAFEKNCPLEKFAELYGIATIRRDARYVSERYAQYGDERTRARNLEEVVRRGIGDRYWLGEPFADARVLRASKYDDYVNRNDIIVSAGRDSFAIDVTYNSTKIADKLERQTNDKMVAVRLPVGFSRLKYFYDNENKEYGERVMPRFVVGLDWFDEKTAKQPAGSPWNERTRFKILHELYVQSLWRYQQMLADDPEVENLATVTMENLNDTFGDALQDSMDRMSRDERFHGIQRILTERFGSAEAGGFGERLAVVSESLAAGDGVYKDTMRVLVQQSAQL